MNTINKFWCEIFLWLDKHKSKKESNILKFFTIAIIALFNYINLLFVLFLILWFLEVKTIPTPDMYFYAGLNIFYLIFVYVKYIKNEQYKSIAKKYGYKENNKSLLRYGAISILAVWFSLALIILNDGIYR